LKFYTLRSNLFGVSFSLSLGTRFHRTGAKSGKKCERNIKAVLMSFPLHAEVIAALPAFAIMQVGF